ncbi:hypothetical protein BHS09_31615 [Myxococcus xanthus]|uniref:Uncharacterized protein n=3 Tax=Myxococcus xanthus TaxID=34 RepID=A0AAE6G5G0_MYXXA|nr:hypothetical protein BHS09_31615 [Myxococcus xanthus]QDE78437.1 hypothetical protein BHS08_31635 [Myxococcus xanthus]
MFTPSPLPAKPSTFLDFMNTVGQQHIDAYDSFFGVSPTGTKLKVSLVTPAPGAAAVTRADTAASRSAV